MKNIKFIYLWLWLCGKPNHCLIGLSLILFLGLIRPLQAKELSLAPDFRLKDMQENTVVLSSYRDKSPVFLFFWATWCPFCRDELKNLNSRYRELLRDNVEVLAVDIGESLPTVERFISNYALVFKVLLDRDSQAAYSYNIVGVPTFILIDKKGRIVFQDHRFPQEYKKLLLE